MAKKKPKRPQGRPESENPRCERIMLRVTVDEWNAIWENAAAAGLGLSEYVRCQCLTKSQRGGAA